MRKPLTLQYSFSVALGAPECYLAVLISLSPPKFNDRRSSCPRIKTPSPVTFSNSRQQSVVKQRSVKVGGKRKNMLEGKEKKRKSQKEHKTRALVCDTPVKKRPIPHRGKKKAQTKTPHDASYNSNGERASYCFFRR